MTFKKIILGDTEEIKILSQEASSIVKEYYDPLLGSEQNDYMINQFQSVSSLTEQLQKGYQCYFVCENDKNIGFLAFVPKENELYLSKFYLEKSARGKGYARTMMNFVIENARKMKAASITLNVNKHNVTKYIYEKLGFVRIRSEKIDIGSGYYMDDYVYEYQLLKK